EAMEKDAGIPITSLRVDGGMVVNQLLMQFQSDIIGQEVICPKIIETTALGAAYAAGLAVGYWANLEDLRKNWAIAGTWQSKMSTEKREKLQSQWKKAVTKSFDWEEE
ncbi:MAG: Glycerol kinase, partial [Bacteroidota bacterium]